MIDPTHDLPSQLIEYTNNLTVAMARAEYAHLGHAALAQQHKDISEAYERAIAEDTANFRNADQRKAELKRRMTTHHAQLCADLDTAEQEKYSTAQDVKRLDEDVTTLRSLLAYESGLLLRDAARDATEAAQVAAGSMPRLIRTR